MTLLANDIWECSRARTLSDPLTSDHKCEELKNQVKILAQSPSFEKIPAVWGLGNSCTYTMYVDIYYTGTLRITVVDAKMAHQIVAKWSADNNVANHYTSENEIPCLAA